ncbi:Plasma kallikrein [Trichinella pseudospiralis]
MHAFLIILTTWFYVFFILKFDLLLQSEATFMCGQTAANDDGMPHYAVFYAVTEEGKFHDCMGIIADSDRIFLLLRNTNSKSNIPNIAIIKLNQPISYAENILPMCLPNKSDTLNESSTCEIAEIYIGVALTNLFTWSLKMLPHEECIKMLNATSINSTYKLCFTEIYGPSFQMLTIYDEDVLTEGSPLVCNIQGRRYLYGVRDFVKEFRKEPYRLPIVVVTFIPPLVDFIKGNM